MQKVLLCFVSWLFDFALYLMKCFISLPKYNLGILLIVLLDMLAIPWDLDTDAGADWNVYISNILVSFWSGCVTSCFSVMSSVLFVWIVPEADNKVHLGLVRVWDAFNSLHLPFYKKIITCLLFLVFSVTGGKTNQLILQNTATKAIIQGLIPDQNYALQIIAFSDDKESKPAQGQFRSMYLLYMTCRVDQTFNIICEAVTNWYWKQ